MTPEQKGHKVKVEKMEGRGLKEAKVQLVTKVLRERLERRVLLETREQRLMQILELM